MTMAPADRAATSRFAEASGLRLHYHEAGTGPAGAAPVVLLHGGGPGASAWSNFGRNLPVFAARFRTLVPDQPGFGRSAKPPVTGNYFTFAADALAGLLDELGLERVAPGRQLARRRHRGPVRAALPRAGRAAGADGRRAA